MRFAARAGYRTASSEINGGDREAIWPPVSIKAFAGGVCGAGNRAIDESEVGTVAVTIGPEGSQLETRETGIANRDRSDQGLELRPDPSDWRRRYLPDC